MIDQAWGRSVPKDMLKKIVATWGARAIYTMQHIDLLPDRQSWSPTGDENKPARAKLLAWINSTGLPFLRKEAKRLYPDESRVVTLDDGLFHIEASPQASYGYLYIRAWELKLTDAEATAFKKGGGKIDIATAARLLGTDEDEVEACLKVIDTKKSAHTMLKLKRGGYVAFAERENRQVLEELRRTDPRMQRGRITDVLQMRPSAVAEGVVYEGS